MRKQRKEQLGGSPELDSENLAHFVRLEIDDLENKKLLLQEHIKGLEVNVTASNDDLKRVFDELLRKKVEGEKMDGFLNQKRKEVEQMEAEYAELVDRLSRETKQIKDSLQVAISEVQLAKQTLEEELKKSEEDGKDRLATLGKELFDLGVIRGEKQSELNRLEATLAPLQKSVSELESKEKQLIRQCSEHAGKLTQLNSELEHVKSEISNLQMDRSFLWTDREKLSMDVQDLRDEKKTIELEVKKIQDQLNALTQERITFLDQKKEFEQKQKFIEGLYKKAGIKI